MFGLQLKFIEIHWIYFFMISLNIIERTVQEAQIIANNRFLRFPSDENLEKTIEVVDDYGLDLPPSYEEVTKQVEGTKENISIAETDSD